MGLLVILIIAIFNYFIGTFIPPSEEKQWKGVVGYKGKMKLMSQCMRFPTMWYERPAKPQISLRIRAV